MHIKALLAFMKVAWSFVSATTYPGYIFLGYISVYISKCLPVSRHKYPMEFLRYVQRAKVIHILLMNASYTVYINQYRSTVLEGLGSHQKRCL